MKSVPLQEITEFLDEILQINSFKDMSNNGLQIQNSGHIKKVAFAVSATMETFCKAKKFNPDLFICHHGLSWGDSLKYITGLNYCRVKYLLQNDIALYGVHLPLDAHPKYGNNAVLCKKLGLKKIKPFGHYHGVPIGFVGSCSATSLKEIAEKYESITGQEPKVWNFGEKEVRKIAVVSGGGLGAAEEAALKQVDLFITGEATLEGYNIAEDMSLNVLIGGHYSTEVFGVKELMALVENEFGLIVEFIDMDIPI